MTRIDPQTYQLATTAHSRLIRALAFKFGRGAVQAPAVLVSPYVDTDGKVRVLLNLDADTADRLTHALFSDGT